MRAVIQRVSKASVTINNNCVATIKTGLLVLVGFEESDNIVDFEWTAKKIINMRIFNNANDVMNLNITDINGELLVVSQFTLFASTQKGNRPSYIRAAKPELAKIPYNQFIQALNNQNTVAIQTGEFGADMQVELVNNGPVTILIDSKNKE